ncbi:MAG: class I adenylate-forming enzyme family protein [Beijerinckiaceae bacterium]
MAAHLYNEFIHPFAGMDVGSLIRDRAAVWGDKPFLVWTPFEDSNADSWSWKRFEYDVARLAAGLKARGIAEGDRVLVHFDNCPETFLARFALAWIGAVAVLSNSVLAGPEIAHTVEISGARAAITQPKLAARVRENCPQLEWIAVTETDAGDTPEAGTAPSRSESFAALYAAEPAQPLPPDPNRPALILFTTGTTSRPKAVLWTHGNVLWGGQMSAMHQAVRSDDVYQVFLPVYHVVGFSWAFLSAMWAGATVVLQPRFSASRFWPVALQNKSTLSAQVHFTADVLSRQEVPQHHFRQFLSGIFLPPVAQKFGVREVSGWGMTEMVSQPITGDPWAAQTARAIGRPAPGYGIIVEDDNRKPVQPGETGHLKVLGRRGLSIFREYFGNQKATSGSFDERGLFDPGDRVILRENGWIEFADRTKDVMKVGGEGVSGSEVEHAVKAAGGIKDAAVVGRADPVWGEVPVAFVELIDPNADREEIKARVFEHCRKSLAKFKQPHDIVILDELPRVGFGKLAKVKIREMAEAMTKEREKA